MKPCNNTLEPIDLNICPFLFWLGGFRHKYVHHCHHFLFHLGCGCLACCSYMWGVFSSDLLLPSFVPFKEKRTANSCRITDINRGWLRGEIATWEPRLGEKKFVCMEIYTGRSRENYVCWGGLVLDYAKKQKQNCWTDFHEKFMWIFTIVIAALLFPPHVQKNEAECAQ